MAGLVLLDFTCGCLAIFIFGRIGILLNDGLGLETFVSVYEYISIALADMYSPGCVAAAERDRRIEPLGLGVELTYRTPSKPMRWCWISVISLEEVVYRSHNMKI